MQEWLDDSSRQPEITSEQQRAELMAMLEQATKEERYLMLLIARALFPEAAAHAWGPPPRDTSDSPDADLIRLCDHLDAVHTAIDAAYEVIPDDDKKRAMVTDPLNAKWFEIAELLYELDGPTTSDGARAVARVLLAQYPDGLDGARQDADMGRLLAIHCAEYLTDHDHPPEIGFGFPVEA